MPAKARPTSTALTSTPRTESTEDGDGGDQHDRGRVDDALDHHRAERRGPADPLAVAQVVAAQQLAQTGRQHVVGQVADEQVARACAGTATT